MKQWIRVALLVLGIAATTGANQAMAIQIDWGGQFWFDNNWLNNYQLDRGRLGNDADPALVQAGGPYVPGAGQKNIVWYSAFLKLQPRIIVNDSVNVRGEFHVGDPVYGFLGRNFPDQGTEELNFTTAERDGSFISAERFWASMITDFGTIELGRAPIEWGLGAIWDSGDDLFDRYQSTGDLVRLTSKFGNFMIQPALTKIAVGNNVGGALDTSAPPQVSSGSDDVTDYNLAVKYDNTEEDFEFGMMWTKRTGNVAQKSIIFSVDPATGDLQPNTSTRINFNLFDFYAKKKIGAFTLAGEVPLYNGNIGTVSGGSEFSYKAIAFALEAGYNSDLWNVMVKAGHAPGQPNAADSRFRAVYLNRNYDLGLLMFHYNVYGMARNNPDNAALVASNNVDQGLTSPYDSPIVNATYAALLPEIKWEKWSLRGGLIAAWADEVAQQGEQFFNHRRRTFHTAVGNQDSFMGWEADLGTAFRWDENSTISWDIGFWFPGDYFAFSNVPGVEFNPGMMFASQVKVGIQF